MMDALRLSSHAVIRKLEVYLRRLPLLTKVFVGAIVCTHLVKMSGFGMIEDRWALSPGKMDLTQMHRLNSYILVHSSLTHALLNLIAVVPLLERFERGVGTLKTTLLITGPLCTFPAALYLGIELFILHHDTPVIGASALAFTLLAAEAVKTSVAQPSYKIVGYDIPTAATPVFWMVLASFLWPGSSALGHFCGLVIGYAYACRYLRLLEPSEWILTKVEQKLSFIFGRLPWYVSLEKRQELNWIEMLPSVGGNRPNSSFDQPGRVLGV